jgi:hypothetical protein
MGQIVSLDAYRISRGISRVMLSAMLVECPLCDRATAPGHGAERGDVRYRCEGMVFGSEPLHEPIVWDLPAGEVYERRA